MSRRIVLLCGAVLLGAAALLSAEEAAPLTLQQCFDLAQKKNEALQVQSERRFQAEQRVLQAKGAEKPDVHFNYQRTFRDTNGGAVAGDLADARLGLTQPLYDGGKRKNNVNLTRNDVQREEVQMQSVRRTLRSQVADAFYSLAQVEADISNVQATLKLMNDRTRDLREWVRLGKSRDSEVLMVESQISALRATEESLKGSRARALDNLSFLIGVDPALIRINDTLPAVTAVAPLDKAIAAGLDRSDIQVLQKDAQSQEYRILIEKGNYKPTLGVDAGWYAAHSGSLKNSDWDAIFTFSFPIYQGGIRQARVAEQESVLRAINDQVSLQKRSVMTEITQLHDGLVSSYAQASAFRDAFDKSEKSYKMQLKDYRYGLVTNLDVISATLSMLDVKRSLDRAVLQVKLDKLLLDIATEQ